ncbi:MAG TPA: hypothetical protein VMU13_02075 [Candidatus Paceibacterota bacterium]|nr:hypothetical protein [Candidatus Paceibacterota bacterium]
MSYRLLLADVNREYAQLTEHELANLGVVVGTYRSLRGNRRKHVAYVGMPITTGKRYYDTLIEHRVKTPDELNAKLGPLALWELVVQPNLREGSAFADRLGKERKLLCIAPSVFDAKPWQWSQHAYMALWFLVLGELSGRHYVMDAWEYSTGQAREVLFSMFLQWAGVTRSNLDEVKQQWGLGNFDHCTTVERVREELENMRKIRVFDSSSRVIHSDVALAKCVDALYWLHDHGFGTQELEKIAWAMKQIPVLSLGCLNWEQPPYDPFTRIYDDARKRLHEFLGFRNY